jgi:hypothetical protein
MTQEADKPETPKLATPDKRPTARELYEREIADNPKWRDTTTPGRGFVIGGVRAADLGGAETEENPYLAQVLKNYPNLTREKALGMIEAFGG